MKAPANRGGNVPRGFCEKRVKNENRRSKRKAHVMILWLAVIIPPFIASLHG
jgi:hypothetical protein